jgi:hypothetical protein
LGRAAPKFRLNHHSLPGKSMHGETPSLFP